MDKYGLHPLLCRISTDHLPSHSALNDLMHTMSSAGFNAVLEPVGLDCGDGKYSDGMTMFLFSRKKCFIWYSTCVNHFLLSICKTAIEPGSAARSAKVCKSHKF